MYYSNNSSSSSIRRMILLAVIRASSSCFLHSPSHSSLYATISSLTSSRACFNRCDFPTDTRHVSLHWLSVQPVIYMVHGNGNSKSANKERRFYALFHNSRGVARGWPGWPKPPPIPSKKKYKAKRTYSIYNIYVAY